MKTQHLIVVVIVGLLGCDTHSLSETVSSDALQDDIPLGFSPTMYPRLAPEEEAPEKWLVRTVRSRQDVLSLVDGREVLEVTHKDRAFLFCTTPIPSFSTQKVDIHGWMYDELNGEWERVFAIRTHTVQSIGLFFDKDTGVLTAEVRANCALKGMPAFSFNVNAVWSQNSKPKVSRSPL